MKTAVIFGSSVEFHCHSFSDLELCIERYNTKKSFRDYPQEYMEEADIVYWDAIGARLKKEIEQNLNLLTQIMNLQRKFIRFHGAMKRS